ncbi:MAG: CDP-alcohol phosphatidyltransferase family protein [Promethearchaeota archaeon]|nr:MAG: CDP-alcohol phosphatidyltransferase family protein [Candidatus Lokiarchaeota archaeon]
MPSQFRLRRVFRPLVGWLAKQFHRLKITPNQVSVLGTVIAVIGCFFFIFIPDYLGSVLFALFIFIAGILDGVDGSLARLTNSTSAWGGFLDSVLDRYTDSFVILSFLFRYPSSYVLLGVPLLFWVGFALIGVIMVSYIRIKAETHSIPNCDVGLAGRSERLFILVIFSSLNCIHASFSYIGLIIVAIISHLTAFYRVFYTLKFND